MNGAHDHARRALPCACAERPEALRMYTRGVGVLMADEAEKLDLDVPALPDDAQKKLKEKVQVMKKRRQMEVVS